MIGCVDRLDARGAIDHWKAKNLDFSAVLYQPPLPSRVARRAVQTQDHGLDKALDCKLIELARESLENRTPIEFKTTVSNINRAVGTMLSGEVSRRHV
jgi:glutamate synthase (NADPH/NADH) large chain